MNQESRKLINSECKTKNRFENAVEENNATKIRECLEEVVDDYHCNARWGNVAHIFVALKGEIIEALSSYQSHSIDAVTTLRKITDALGKATNDERDGLLLLEEVFHIPFDYTSTHQADERLLASAGTTNWKKLYREKFSRVYER